jgi:hypothetical protein
MGFCRTLTTIAFLLFLVGAFHSQAMGDAGSLIPVELRLGQFSELQKKATGILSSKEPKATLFGIHVQVDSAKGDGRSVYVYLRYKYASAIYTAEWDNRRGDIVYQGKTHTWWGYSTCDGEDTWQNAAKKWTDIERLINHAYAQLSSKTEISVPYVFYNIQYSIDTGCCWNIKMMCANRDVQVAYKVNYRNEMEPMQEGK